jgi:transcription-repair coupling factor (superfamily II helicase)
MTRRPTLILVPNETERIKVTDALCHSGINALGYKKRDLVLHNIRASHDVDRERLLVLSKLLSGETDAVVATPTAALGLTMPPEMLEENSLRLTVGDIISPEELSDRLVAMGYARVDSVESRGQFSRRGGILDFFGGETEEPVRVEFFGDEVDRMSYFDPISQRTTDLCQSARLLPAAEVVVDRAARERILASLNRLLKNAKDGAAKEKIQREIAVVDSELSVDFRDKFLPLIYENQATLFDYFGKNGRYISFVIGTNNCLDEMKKQAKIYENDKHTLHLHAGCFNFFFFGSVTIINYHMCNGWKWFTRSCCYQHKLQMFFPKIIRNVVKLKVA